MLRSITTLPLPGLAQIKLREQGLLYCEDLWNEKGFVKDGLKILQQCNLQNSFEILTEVPATKSSLDIWQEECSMPNIVTFCEELDTMLDGGISLGEVTELSGAPGSGKTQMCLQLSVDVQIPESLGGVGGKAIFIDSSCDFSPARLKEIAAACVKHCHAINTQENQALINFTTETVMKGIYYMSVNDHVELIAAVESMEELLQNIPEVSLVVVDSITFPFRLWVTNSLQRTKLLCTLMDKLKMIASKHRVAVVVTNQLTTRIDSSECRLIPSMGDSFGHLFNHRLMLGCLQNSCFAAYLLKSTRSPQKSAKFQVLPEGIRSCGDTMTLHIGSDNPIM